MTSVAEEIQAAAHRELGPHLANMTPEQARFTLLRVTARQVANIAMDLARILAPIMKQESREELAILLSVLRTYEELAGSGELDNTSWEQILANALQYILAAKATAGKNGAN